MSNGPRRKVHDEPGHAHLLTFSSYKGRRFFADNAYCQFFVKALDAARSRHGFLVWAYVVMPEHVHLLICPGDGEARIATILQSVKQPVAARVKKEVPPNLPGNRFRLWQRGGGHDRNIWSDKALQSSLEYIHENPVRRGLVQTAQDYEWSSARWYERREGPLRMDAML